ncbi:hypothetical protein PINS_up003526 [Pythium insidiosum]|nr:hypothetical protein PINS_up003526 [Pythium insidiosum]
MRRASVAGSPVPGDAAPDTPQRRRTANIALREELAAATAAIKDQRWIKMLTQKVGRRGGTDHDDDHDDEGHGDDFRHAREGISPKLPPVAPSVLVPLPTEDIVSTLDPRFFTASFDGVAFMLENLPTARHEVDEFLQTEISAVDVAKDLIIARLADDVRANQDAFIEGMKQVQEVDLDLVRAQIHVKNGRRLLVSSKADLIRTSLEIVKLKRNRDRVESIIDLGSRILHFFDEEERMNDALQQHAFTKAVEICLALREDMSADDLQDVLILKKLHNRVKNFLPELRHQFDKSLRKVASEFDPRGYRELLQAYIALAEHSETLGFEFSNSSLHEVLSKIPEVVVRCIDDLTRQFIASCFGERLSPKKPKGKAQKKHSSTHESNQRELAVSSSGTEQAVENVRRVYEALTNLMHTYYLLVQWHRDPFNPSNDDPEYLHRCGIDDDDDDDDDAEDVEDEGSVEGIASGGLISPSSKELVSPRRRRRNSSVCSTDAARSQSSSPYSSILCETGMTLVRYRKIVWENMQHNVMEVLERLDTSSGFKLEHMISLSQATSVFIEVGEEFTGSPSTRMRSLLRLKCEQYITSFHDDNLELLRMLIDTERWQRIFTEASIVDVTNEDILRLVEKRSGYRLNQAKNTQSARYRSHINAIHERGVFTNFHVSGNPFSALGLVDKDEKLGDTNSNQQDKLVEIRTTDVGNNGKQIEPELSPTQAEVSNQLIEEDEFVLTSSSLSGFVRLCGVYLKMMYHLPHIAWDVFLLLLNLHDFYLYAVFTNFVEPDRAAQLFRAQLADVPRWDTLRHTLARVARDFSSGETILQASIIPAESSVFVVPSHEKKTALLGKPSTPSAAPNEREQVVLRRLTRIPKAMEQCGDNNSYAFVERCVAVASVASQTKVLDALRSLAATYLAERYHCLVEDVYKRSQDAAHQLQDFVFRSTASAILKPSSVTSAVLEVRWDEVKFLRERHNDYVVGIVRKCGEVWGTVQIHNDGSVPVAARDALWTALVQEVMDAVLLGFSLVPRCTPQGRALMSMDLLALQTGLDLINHVSSTRITRGYEYVSRFVKAFYLDEGELVSWVANHKNVYSKVLLANLVRHGVGSTMSARTLRDYVQRVEQMLQT